MDDLWRLSATQVSELQARKPHPLSEYADAE